MVPNRGRIFGFLILVSAFALILTASGCGGGKDHPQDGGADGDGAIPDGDADGSGGDGDLGQDGGADGDLEQDGGADGADPDLDGSDADGADGGDLSADGEDGEDGGADGGDTAPDVGLSLADVLSWQRGPVRLPFEISGPVGAIADLSFAYSLDGQAFSPATALPNTAAGFNGLSLEEPGVGGRFVWDSWRNVTQDEPQVWIRASARLGGVVVATDTTGPFDLHNAVDTIRPVLVPHPYDEDASGGLFNGTRASLLHLQLDGSLVDSGVDLTCGENPALARFTADGRFGVILSEGDGHNKHSLTPLAVARDGSVSTLGPAMDLVPLGLSASDLIPTPDGSGLWLVHYTGEGGLFFLSFEDGQPALVSDLLGNALLLEITLPAAMAPLGDNRRAFVSGGALFNEASPVDLTLVDLQALSILDQQSAGVGSLADRVAVTSDGTRVLVPAPDPWTSNPDLVLSVQIAGDAISSWTSTQVVAPAWVVIHPADSAALITSWDADSVYVLDLTVDPPLVSQTLTGVALADHLDCVRRGALIGLCLISAVEELERITLLPDATALRGTPFSFGPGYAAITSGPAIQP